MTTFVDIHASIALRLRTIAQATEQAPCRFYEWLIRIGMAVGARPPSHWRDRSPAYGPTGPVLILQSDPVLASPVPYRWGCRVSAFEGR